MDLQEDNDSPGHFVVSNSSRHPIQLNTPLVGAIDEELIKIDRRKNCESLNDTEKKERGINTSGDASLSIKRTSFLCMIASDLRAADNMGVQKNRIKATSIIDMGRNM